MKHYLVVDNGVQVEAGIEPCDIVEDAVLYVCQSRSEAQRAIPVLIEQHWRKIEDACNHLASSTNCGFEPFEGRRHYQQPNYVVVEIGRDR